MRTKSILTTTAIALVAGLGSASATEQFITTAGIEALTGIHAIPMLPDELAKVRGAHARIWTNGGPTNVNFHAKFFRTQVHGCLDVSGRGSPFPFISSSTGHC